MLEIIFDRDARLMRATRPTLASPWSAATEIVELRSPEGETSPELSPDGLTLFFTSARANAADIYMARRPDRMSPWSAPQRIAELSSAAFDVSLATTSALTGVRRSRNAMPLTPPDVR